MKNKGLEIILDDYYQIINKKMDLVQRSSSLANLNHYGINIFTIYRFIIKIS